MNLAAAGGLDVGDAAEIAATALTQFKLSGSDVGHVADLLAAGAGKAQGDVSDLSMALKQGGLVASQTGLTIEETTGALAAFAKAGLIGSDAGTSFKTMLQRLTPQSKEAQTMMDDLGISAYDAQGNFIGLSEFAGVLQSGLKDLTVEQRNSALATMFGSDAVRAASVLYNEGASGIQSWEDAVNDSGYAAETASARMDNLKGDLEMLSGSLETVFIESGSGANDVLRQLVQSAEAVVDAVGGIPAPILSAITMLVGGGGLVTLGVGGLGKLAISVNDVITSVKSLGISFKTASVSAGLVGVAIAAGTYALGEWAQNAAEAKARTEEYAATLTTLGKTTDATIDTITNALTADDRNWADKLFGDGQAKSLVDDAKTLGLSIDDMTQYILGNSDAIDKVNNAWEVYSKQTGSSSFDWDHFKGSLDDQSNSLTNAQKAAIQKAEADKQAGVASKEAATSTDTSTDALTAYAQALSDGTATSEDYTDALKEQIKTEDKAAGVALSLSDAQIQYQDSLASASDAIKENGQNLDITTEAGRKNRAALDDIAKSGWDLVTSMSDANASTEDLQSSMQSARDDFINTATQMGMNQDEAEALADSYGLIPDTVSTEVVAKTSKAQADIQNIKQILASMPNGVVNIYTAGYEKTYSYLMSVQSAIRSINGSSVRVAMGAGGQGGITFADGGAVHGPGTSTSDSIAAWLSDGEHVIPAREVQAAGGQQAIYQLRAAIQGGWRPGYADGGAVTRSVSIPASYMSPRVSVAAPQVQMPSVLALYAEDGTFMGNMRTVARTEAIRVGQSRNR